MKIRLPAAIMLVFRYFLLIAQELPVYQQYLLNPNLINPAITGYGGCTSILLTDRHQWIGIPDAPSTQAVGLQKGILIKSGKIHGVGLNLYYDNNGAFRKSGGDLMYAYHFKINRQRNINIGLGLLISVYQNSLDESEFTSVYDPIISGGVTRSLNPDAGAGIFMYNPKFYAGISGLRLMSNSGTLQETERHFYLNSGFFIKNDKSPFEFEPALLLKLTESFKSQIDINFSTVLNGKYWYTLSYRNNLTPFPLKSISILSVFGANIGNFSFAYAFDLGLASIQMVNYGSHEFMIKYKICQSENTAPDCPTYKGLIKRYSIR